MACTPAGRTASPVLATAGASNGPERPNAPVGGSGGGRAVAWCGAGLRRDRHVVSAPRPCRASERHRNSSRPSELRDLPSWIRSHERREELMPASTLPADHRREQHDRRCEALAALSELRGIIAGGLHLEARGELLAFYLDGCYRVVSEITAFIVGGFPAGPAGSSANGPSPVVPADFAVAGLTTRFRLRVLTGVNSTAPGVDLTYGLYPVTAFAGGSGLVGPASYGTVVAGSTVTRPAPAAGSALLDASGDFTIPAPGAYQILASISGTTAAASKVEFVAELQVRNA